MILPITYNCEAQGASFFSPTSSRSNFLSEKQCKNPIDKLQGLFLKHNLGVHSRASNWAVESKTNRNSVIPHIVRRIIGFYNHLRNSESPIIINSLKLSMELNEEVKTSWFSNVKKIDEALSNPIDLLVNSKVLLRRLNESIKKTLYKQGKLQFYTDLWECPGFENYLNLPNKKLCRAITKLRLSAHKFPIEKQGVFIIQSRLKESAPTQCQNSIISRTRVNSSTPFLKIGKVSMNSHKQNLLTQFWHVKMMTCYQKLDFYV